MESKGITETNLKYKFDQLVSRDKEIDNAYNYIMKNTLDKVLQTMTQKSVDFENLFNGIYYGGSYYDKLAVGKLRHEFDLDVIYKVPEKYITVKECGGNFMPLEVDKNHSKKFESILDDNIVSSEKMKHVLKTAADRALSALKNKVTLPNGIVVNVSRRDKLPYTLKLKPQGGKHKSSVEIDLVPALRLPTSKLPEQLQQRIQSIQNSTCTKKVDDFLAIAMPIVHKDKLEIDFPRLARQMLSERPSAKMAIMLLKQERNEKGGPMEKIWSHAIKMAALHEIYKNPSLEHWNEAKLADRHRDVRNSLQGYLERGEMIDIFYPEINMMSRIKSTNVKDQVARYLDKSAKKFQQTAKTFVCGTSQCNKYFRTNGASYQHAVDKHQQQSFKAKESKSPKTLPCALQRCNRVFRDEYGALQHSVMTHKEEAKQKDIWRNYLREQGKIPCTFCNCVGGFVRGFSSMGGYNAHAMAMNH